MTVKIKADIPAHSGITFKGNLLSSEGIMPIPSIGGKVTITLESGESLQAYYSEELSPDSTFSEYEDRAISWAQQLINELKKGA
ncbi:TPA: hypothetical protein ACQZKB_003790 [Klebsiella pneumoniae]